MLERFRKGPTAAEQGLPAYTNWADFEPDEAVEPDHDDAEAHHAVLQHLVSQDEIDAHFRETQ